MKYHVYLKNIGLLFNDWAVAPIDLLERDFRDLKCASCANNSQSNKVWLNCVCIFL